MRIPSYWSQARTGLTLRPVQPPEFRREIILIGLGLGSLAGKVAQASPIDGLTLFMVVLTGFALLCSKRANQSAWSFVPAVGVASLIAFSVALYSRPTALAEYHRAYDAPFHVFASSGYWENWWDPVETRWNGGYLKASYPPLAHQLVALAAISMGDLDLAYTRVALLLLVLAPYAMYRFACPSVGKRAALVSSLIFVLAPPMRIAIFVWGQFAGVASLLLAMLAAAASADYLRTSRYQDGVLAACLAGVAVAFHHNTAIFFLPVCVAVVAFTTILRGEANVRVQLRRTAVLGSLIVVAGAAVIFPFWDWLTRFQQPIAIPHPSRLDFFSHPHSAKRFVLHLYGPLLVLAPIAAVRMMSRRHVAFVMAFVFYCLLGLGGTTVVPQVVFGSKWEWLTYERFALWGLVFAIPIIAALLVSRESKAGRVLALVGVTALGLGAGDWHQDPTPYRMTPNPVDMQPILAAFERYPECSERYLALGYQHQLPAFSTYTGARTLDGQWYTSRTDPLLHGSGVGGLTDALHYPNGPETLDAFLSRGSPAPANCVFVNSLDHYSEQYQRLLRSHNWKKAESFSNGTYLWLLAAPQRLKATDDVPEISTLSIAAWGLLPITFLVLSLVLQVSQAVSTHHSK